MNRKRDIAIAMAAILIVCLFMALTSGCEDRDAEASLCEHVWTAGASQDYAKKNPGSVTDPVYFYTCTVCRKEISVREVTTVDDDGLIRLIDDSSPVEVISIQSSDGKECLLCDAGSGRMCPHGGIDIEPDSLIVPVSDPNGLSLGTLIVKSSVWDTSTGDFQIDAEAPVIEFDDKADDLTILWELDEPTDISFCVSNVEVIFTWNDGKFDVIYDADDLTNAAETFFKCIKPYLNAHIKDAAERLNERASQ